MIGASVDAQAEQHRESKRRLEVRVRENVNREPIRALARTRRGDTGMNYWPGFVDALSTLVLGIIFLLTVFVVVQFYLQQEVAGKDTALDRLKSQIAQLTNLLSLEKGDKADVENQLAQLRATLAVAESERDKFKGLSDSAGTDVAAAQNKAGALATQLEGEKKL